ncbi:MAG: ParA family protein [Clostridiaceae bacterium]|nr:ParA family protein [Clostridiaceae bacterium]
MPKIITFGTLKGGTGKTATASATVGILAQLGNKVLAIDADPQANLTSNLGIDETVEGYMGIQDIFEDSDVDINKVIIKTPIAELPTLDAIGSSILMSATELKIINYAGRELLIKNYLNKNKDMFAEYDYIIIDTNPSMSVINQNCFILSDAIILVSDVGMNSIKGIELIDALWGNICERLSIPNNIKGILLNKIDQRNSLSNDFIEYCEEDPEIKKLLFKNYIPINVKISETELLKKPINLTFNSSVGSKAYSKFVEELIERI